MNLGLSPVDRRWRMSVAERRSSTTLQVIVTRVDGAQRSPSRREWDALGSKPFILKAFHPPARSASAKEGKNAIFYK